MEGFYSNKISSFTGGTMVSGTEKLKLLAKNKQLEIMCQQIALGATVWLMPAGNDEDIEFFFVHTGALEISLENGPAHFGPGDSFYVKGLKHDLLLKTTADTTLLYLSTMPVFDTEMGFQAELTKLLEQIDEKDDYTLRHSRNVMRYSVRLYERLVPHCASDALNGIVIASLFHDVGKCRTPDAILKKKGSLTREEYAVMQRHSLDSADILRTHFEERIVNWAKWHHERLDGSGYPLGLTGADMPFESRILAVADVFDAMTTNRGYNRVKCFEEAGRELRGMPDKYDATVVDALCALIEEGVIIQTDSPTNRMESK